MSVVPESYTKWFMPLISAGIEILDQEKLNRTFHLSWSVREGGDMVERLKCPGLAESYV
jgi:hypothetical protein